MNIYEDKLKVNKLRRGRVRVTRWLSKPAGSGREEKERQQTMVAAAAVRVQRRRQPKGVAPTI